jgi:ATP-dependent DNA helicase RecQ
MCDYISLLRTYFVYDTFRTGQLETITNIIENKRDVLTVLPTSTGKTLIYQFLTIYMRNQDPLGITVVVSPLISLMIDQVNSWNGLFSLENGVIIRDTAKTSNPVAVLLGSAQDDSTVELRACSGEFPVVYISPEKLQFLSKNIFKHVKLLVVDECHCISEHGNSFRPSYRTLRTYFPGVQTLALTATAPDRIQRDIVNNLELTNPVLVKGSVYRDNLRLTSRVKCGVRDVDIASVRSMISALHGAGRCVIFATTRKECESLAKQLGAHATAYHAGLTSDERKQVAANFMAGDIIVATNCFGLGVDYPDIRLVIHYGLPRSILGYVQECGRAGRDGRLSECLAIYSATDISKYNSTPLELSEATQMLRWIQNEGNNCRQKNLVEYFNESFAGRTCTWGTGRGCDVCDDHEDNHDQNPDTHCKTSDIRLLLTAIHQTGNYSGKRLPIDFLLGSKSKKLKRFVKVPNSVYNNGKHLSAGQWMNLYHVIIKRKFIREIITARGYVIYKLTLLGVQFR